MLRSTLIASLAISFITILAGNAQADLVSNGNFATGDFINWTVSGDGIGIDSAFANTAAGDTSDAAFSAASGDPSAGVLSQAVTTTPGASYDLNFAVVDEAGFGGDSFTISFGGFSATITGDTAGPYQDFVDLYTAEAFSIPGTAVIGASTALSFEGLNDPTSGIDWNLSDVALTCTANCAAPTSVPEPSALPLLLTTLALGAGTR